MRSRFISAFLLMLFLVTPGVTPLCASGCGTDHAMPAMAHGRPMPGCGMAEPKQAQIIQPLDSADCCGPHLCDAAVLQASGVERELVSVARDTSTAPGQISLQVTPFAPASGPHAGPLSGSALTSPPYSRRRTILRL